MSSFFDASMATWSAASFPEPKVVVVWAERNVRDWRFLWLRKRTRGEVVKVIYDPPIKVRLSTSTYTPEAE